VTDSVRRLSRPCTKRGSQAFQLVLWTMVALVRRRDRSTVDEAIADTSARTLPEVGEYGLGRGQMQCLVQEACSILRGGAVGKVPALALVRGQPSFLASPQTQGTRHQFPTNI